jgi:uncharacterized protein with PIN domain
MNNYNCPNCNGNLKLLVDAFIEYEVEKSRVVGQIEVHEYDHRFLVCENCGLSGNTQDCNFSHELHSRLDDLVYPD